jgi:hypothetical protein
MIGLTDFPAQPAKTAVLSEAILHFGFFFLQSTNTRMRPAAIRHHQRNHNFISPGGIVDPYSHGIEM